MFPSNRSPKCHCFRGFPPHVEQYEVEKIRYPEQRGLGGIPGAVHLNTVAAQYTGTDVLRRLAAGNNKDVLFRSQVSG